MSFKKGDTVECINNLDTIGQIISYLTKGHKYIIKDDQIINSHYIDLVMADDGKEKGGMRADSFILVAPATSTTQSTGTQPGTGFQGHNSVATQSFERDDIIECINASNCPNITLGKHYKVTGRSIMLGPNNMTEITDDRGCLSDQQTHRFKLITPATSLSGVSSTTRGPIPSTNKFKPGDVVINFLGTKYIILQYTKNGRLRVSDMFGKAYLGDYPESMFSISSINNLPKISDLYKEYYDERWTQFKPQGCQHDPRVYDTGLPNSKKVIYCYKCNIDLDNTMPKGA